MGITDSLTSPENCGLGLFFPTSYKAGEEEDIRWLVGFKNHVYSYTGQKAVWPKQFIV